MCGFIPMRRMKETKVYTDQTHEFPPSRGRDCFQIKQNGEIIFKTIGETDTSQIILGNFKI
jgi:hypothetical protein